jgi:hypothetical protein
VYEEEMKLFFIDFAQVKEISLILQSCFVPKFEWAEGGQQTYKKDVVTAFYLRLC